MRKVAGFGMAMTLIGVSLALAQPAAAAVRVGNDCFADTVVEGSTLTQLASDPANPLPLTVPEAGVVTRWTSKSELGAAVPVRLKVLRPTSVPGQLSVIGESSEQIVAAGVNTFNTRIPVQAGDRLGLYGHSTSGGLTCPGKSGDQYGYFAGDVPTGSTQAFESASGRVAVSALVEPDEDHDGYGDETQDRCPQSADVQVPCPPLVLDAVAEPPGAKSVLILVATSTEAPIAVYGTAGGLKLSASPRAVAPGTIAAFRLPFTRALRSRLAKLPRTRSLSLKVSAEGRSLAGVPAASQLTVKLRGHGRPPTSKNTARG